jgi:CHASE2 domain-containing sensor protein
MLPYIGFSIFGIKLGFKNKKSQFLMIPLCIVGVFIGLQLFMYRRFIPVVDLFMILFAGYGFTEFFKKQFYQELIHLLEDTVN